MNTFTRSARLCVFLLFCFGLPRSEGLLAKGNVADGRAGNRSSHGRAASAGNEELRTDDGAPESSISGSNLICVNRLTPTIYPATLQTVRIYFLPIFPTPTGAQIRLLAFAGAQGTTQPPDNPTLLVDQTVTIPVLPLGGGFVDFPIQNGPTINNGDLYVGFQAPSAAGRVTFVADVTGQPQQRAFRSSDNGQIFAGPLTLPDGAPVNLLMRAIVTNNAAPAPRIEAPSSLGFDNASSGVTQVRSLMVRNTGDATLNIAGVASNDPQFTVFPLTLPLAIAPGGQSAIALRFATTSLGAQNGTLTITSDDPARPSLNVTLSGVGGQPPTSLTIFTNSGAEQTGSIIALFPGFTSVNRTQYAVFVPDGASQLKIDLNGNQNLALFARFDQRLIPSPSSGALGAADHTSNNPGVAPESISITPSTSPPLRSGLYYIAIVNLGPGAANFSLSATVTGGTAPGLATTVSAASFSGPDVASEAIVAAYGSGLATSSQAAGSLPLPTDLAGTTIKIRDNEGNERLAPLFFVSPLQANFQIAPGTAGGAAFLTFTSGDGRISTGTPQIVRVAPGIFAANSDGQGVPAAVVCRADDPQLQTCRSVARLD